MDKHGEGMADGSQQRVGGHENGLSNKSEKGSNEKLLHNPCCFICFRIERELKFN
jgi:hypothetical protein